MDAGVETGRGRRGGRGRWSSWRGITLYLIAFIVVPNAVILILGRFLYLVRPPVNADYALLAPLFVLAGAIPAGVAAGLLLMLDFLRGLVPAYQMGPQTALESIAEIPILPPALTLTAVAIAVVSVVVAAGLAALSLRHLPRRWAPAAVVLLVAALMVPLEMAGGREAGAVASDREVVTSGLLFLARGAVATGGKRPAAPLALDVPSATEPLFDALAAGEPLPDRIVLVVMESMGLPRDPAMERLQRSAMADPRLRERYDVVVDTVPFRGSTVPAEIRELCRAYVTTVHPDPDLIPADRCLPALLDRRGYHTVAVHGFAGSFFRRASWYPGLGFDEVYLGSTVAQALASDARCGVFYIGACDGPIADWIGQRLEAAADEKLFIHWLTLNAHSPAPTPDPARTDLQCDIVPGLDPDLCRLMAHHDLVMSALVDAALAPANPRTLFVVVGDHPPPLVDPRVHRQFDPHHVPAVLLWPRQ